MTTEPQTVLVLKNEAGEYFALPTDLLERSRGPAGQTAEIARLFAVEAAQLPQTAQRAAIAPALDDEADTAGHAIAEYEDEYGWKGPIGTNPYYVAQGGVPLPNLGAVLIIAAGIVSTSYIGINGPEYEP